MITLTLLALLMFAITSYGSPALVMLIASIFKNRNLPLNSETYSIISKWWSVMPLVLAVPLYTITILVIPALLFIFATDFSITAVLFWGGLCNLMLAATMGNSKYICISLGVFAAIYVGLFLKGLGL